MLKHSADPEVSSRIFAMFEGLAAELENAKMQVAMDGQELRALQALRAPAARTSIKSVIPHDDEAEAHNPATWDDRFMLDALQLRQRAIECKDVKDKVFAKVQELTSGVSFKEQRMADVKGMPRAHVKLQE